jgi:hypothetical protein
MRIKWPTGGVLLGTSAYSKVPKQGVRWSSMATIPRHLRRKVAVANAVFKKMFISKILTLPKIQQYSGGRRCTTLSFGCALIDVWRRHWSLECRRIARYLIMPFCANETFKNSRMFALLTCYKGHLSNPLYPMMIKKWRYHMDVRCGMSMNKVPSIVWGHWERCSSEVCWFLVLGFEPIDTRVKLM